MASIKNLTFEISVKVDDKSMSVLQEFIDCFQEMDDLIP